MQLAKGYGHKSVSKNIAALRGQGKSQTEAVITTMDTANQARKKAIKRARC